MRLMKKNNPMRCWAAMLVVMLTFTLCTTAQETVTGEGPQFRIAEELVYPLTTMNPTDCSGSSITLTHATPYLLTFQHLLPTGKVHIYDTGNNAGFTIDTWFQQPDALCAIDRYLYEMYDPMILEYIPASGPLVFGTSLYLLDQSPVNGTIFIKAWSSADIYTFVRQELQIEVKCQDIVQPSAQPVEFIHLFAGQGKVNKFLSFDLFETWEKPFICNLPVTPIFEMYMDVGLTNPMPLFGPDLGSGKVNVLSLSQIEIETTNPPQDYLKFSVWVKTTNEYGTTGSKEIQIQIHASDPCSITTVLTGDTITPTGGIGIRSMEYQPWWQDMMVQTPPSIHFIDTYLPQWFTTGSGCPLNGFTLWEGVSPSQVAYTGTDLAIPMFGKDIELLIPTVTTYTIWVKAEYLDGTNTPLIGGPSAFQQLQLEVKCNSAVYQDPNLGFISELTFTEGTGMHLITVPTAGGVTAQSMFDFSDPNTCPLDTAAAGYTGGYKITSVYPTDPYGTDAVWSPTSVTFDVNMMLQVDTNMPVSYYIENVWVAAVNTYGFHGYKQVRTRINVNCDFGRTVTLVNGGTASLTYLQGSGTLVTIDWPSASLKITNWFTQTPNLDNDCPMSYSLCSDVSCTTPYDDTKLKLNVNQDLEIFDPTPFNHTFWVKASNGGTTNTVFQPVTLDVKCNNVITATQTVLMADEGTPLQGTGLQLIRESSITINAADLFVPFATFDCPMDTSVAPSTGGYRISFTDPSGSPDFTAGKVTLVGTSPYTVQIETSTADEFPFNVWVVATNTYGTMASVEVSNIKVNINCDLETVTANNVNVENLVYPHTEPSGTMQVDVKPWFIYSITDPLCPVTYKLCTDNVCTTDYIGTDSTMVGTNGEELLEINGYQHGNYNYWVQASIGTVSKAYKQVSLTVECMDLATGPATFAESFYKDTGVQIITEANTQQFFNDITCPLDTVVGTNGYRISLTDPSGTPDFTAGNVTIVGTSLYNVQIDTTGATYHSPFSVWLVATNTFSKMGWIQIDITINVDCSTNQTTIQQLLIQLPKTVGEIVPSSSADNWLMTSDPVNCAFIATNIILKDANFNALPTSSLQLDPSTREIKLQDVVTPANYTVWIHVSFTSLVESWQNVNVEVKCENVINALSGSVIISTPVNAEQGEVFIMENTVNVIATTMFDILPTETWKCSLQEYYISDVLPTSATYTVHPNVTLDGSSNLLVYTNSILTTDTTFSVWVVAVNTYGNFAFKEVIVQVNAVYSDNCFFDFQFESEIAKAEGLETETTNIHEIECPMSCTTSSKATPIANIETQIVNVNELPLYFDFAHLYNVIEGQITYAYIPQIPPGLIYDSFSYGSGSLEFKIDPTSPVTNITTFIFPFYAVFCRKEQNLVYSTLKQQQEIGIGEMQVKLEIFNCIGASKRLFDPAQVFKASNELIIDDPDVPITKNLSEFFKTYTEGCKFEYRLVKALNEDDLDTNSEFIYITEDSLLSVYQDVPNNFNFRVEGKNDAHTFYLNMLTEILIPEVNEEEEVPEPQFVTNLPPEFKEPVVHSINIWASLLLDGSFETDYDIYIGESYQETSANDGVLTYTSPKAVDEEGDDIKMEFQPDKELSGLTFTDNGGGSFSIRFDLKELDISESFNIQSTVKVILSDNVAKTVTDNFIDFTIDFTKEEALPSEYEYYQEEDVLTEEQDLNNKAEGGEANKTEEEEKQGSTTEEAEVKDKPKTAADIMKEFKEQEVLKEQKEEIKKLESSGAVKDKEVGFIFPGVNVNAQKSKVKGAGASFNAPPKMVISPVSPSGDFSFDFNTDMFFPEKIDQSFYNKVFKIQLINDKDSADRFKGEFNSNNRRLEENENSEKNRLTFRPVVSEHSAKKIAIHLEFENPNKISRSEPDNFFIDIIQPQLLKSATNYQAIDMKQVLEDSNSLMKSCPPIIDPNLGKSLTSGARKGGQAMSAVGQGNFFLTLIMGGSMQQLWGMIRTLQMVILVALVEIRQPPHTFVFFKACLEVASIDVYDAAGIYEKIFVFKDTAPLNQYFEMMGITDKNFTMNSGSFFPFILNVFMYAGLQIVLLKLAVKFFRYKCCRKIGMRVDNENQTQAIKFGLQKLILETHFDIFITGLLGHYAFLADVEKGETIGSFFITASDAINSILTIFFTGVCVFFPIWGFRGIKNNFEQLREPHVQERFQVLISDNKTKELPQAMYNVFFMIRRAIISFVLVFLVQYPYFQCAILINLSIVNICYMIVYKPLKVDNGIEIYNETTIYLTTMIMTNFLNVAQPIEVIDMMGWVLIGVAGINLVVNIMITMIISIKDLFNERQTRSIEKKVNKIFKTIDIERKKLIKHCPQEAKYFEEDLNEQQKIQNVRDWHKQRSWMLSNNLDPKIFPEDANYYKLIDDLHLLQKAQVQRLGKAIQHLAAQRTHKEAEEKSKQKAKEVMLNLLKNKKLPKVKARSVDKKKNLETVPEVSQDALSSSSSSSGEEDTVDKRQIFKKQKQEIEANHKLRNAQLLKKFDTNDQTKRMQAIQMVRKLTEVHKDPKIAKLLKNTIDLEFNNYMSDKKVHPQVSRLLDFKQKEKHDLTFLLEQDHEEYANDLNQDLEEEDIMLYLQYEQSQGLITIINAGVNGFLQSFLHSILKIDMIARYFLCKEYESDTSTEEDVFLCGLMHQIFSNIFQKQIKLMQELEVPIDSSHFLEWFDTILNIEIPHDASDFMDFCLIRLESETQDREEMIGHQYSLSSFIDGLCMIELVKEKRCPENHFISSYSETTKTFKVPFKQSPQESLMDFFNEPSVQTQCSKCNKKVEIVTNCVIKSQPELVIVDFDVIDVEEQIKKFTNQKVPLVFRMEDYHAIKLTDQEPTEKYKLVSLVHIDGTCMKDSDYVTYSLRGEKWYKFTQDKFEVVELSHVLEQTQPQVLIYQKEKNLLSLLKTN